jgi:2-C-methyl-D-erythritol 4-phosphate cytidylyltransferase
LPRDVGVVLVAAGRGERIGGLPKQFRTLAGVPMLLRALRPFAAHPLVGHIVVVLAPADAAAPPEWLATLAGGSLSIVAGGAERTDSVAAGIAALPSSCRVVLVHDAARPFVGADTVQAVIAAAAGGTAAIAAVPVSDTLKEAAAGSTAILRTVPRERIWRAQTPQGFPRQVIEEAHRRAASEGVVATDDAALVERTGAVVHLVADSPRNFKITTADDLLLAELWAAHPS